MSAIRHVLRVFAACALALAAGPASGDAATPLAGKAILDRVARVALDLARKGRRVESDVALAVLRDLGAPAADVATHRQAAAKALASAKDAGLPQADVAKSCAKLAADLAAGLASADGETKATLARQVVRLDDSVAEAHAVLGHVASDGRFVSKDVAACHVRRAAIQDAVSKSRRLDVPYVEEESGLPVIERIHGRKGRCVKLGAYSVHSVDYEPGQIARQFREVIRAYAFSNWLFTGTLALPRFSGRYDVVIVSSQDTYAKAVADAVAHREIAPAYAEAAKKWAGYDGATYSLLVAQAESDIRPGALLHVLCRRPEWAVNDRQTALFYPHINWLCSNLLGIPWRGVGKFGAAAKGAGGGETRDTPVESAERAEMARLARAGLRGTRRWIQWLTARGEDPPWSRSMVASLAMLQENDLLKSTLVVDYLCETGEFAKLVDSTRALPSAPATFEPRVAGGLGAFEARWREWLLADGPPSALAQRLAAPDGDAASPGEAAALRRLDEIRRATLDAKAPPLAIDRDLSDGCRAHANYLAKHPKQLDAWPDAHEEYPGEDGYTPAGSRAGLSSVIAGGTSSPADAIDGWMGTFYHRLPLLDPGLIRIGWSQEGGVAVLDALGMVAPTADERRVAWPAPSSTGVPRRFAPELPSPVPGEDQAAWGYPITLQLFGPSADADVALRLCLGKRGGAEVPCHFSSPRRPSNPTVVPRATYCLIPKATLAPGTTYTVVASGLPENAEFAWSFTTGAK